MINKMNKMEVNDEMNEMMVHDLNRMKVTRQICNIPLLKYMKNGK